MVRGGRPAGGAASAPARWHPSCCTACRCRSARPIRSIAPLPRRSCAALGARVEPAWISDHLCWSGVGGHTRHDLLPLPYTEEALAHVGRASSQVQERLGRQILVENVSSYLTSRDSTMTEWEFLARAGRARRLRHPARREQRLRERDQPRLRSADAYLDGLPVERVGQIHLAGHSDHGTHLLDTHDDPVSRRRCGSSTGRAVRRFGAVSTLVEWDEHIPELAELLAEAERRARVEHEVLGVACCACAELQRALPSSDPQGPEAGRPSGRPADVVTEIRGDSRLGATDRLHGSTRHVQGATRRRPRRGLSAGRAILGAEQFGQLARDYVTTHPSTHPSLRWFGRTSRPSSRASLQAGPPAFLADLARLEWARVAVFDAPDAEPLRLADLESLPPQDWPALRLRLIPACLVLESAWPVHEVWAASEPEANSPECGHAVGGDRGRRHACR